MFLIFTVIPNPVVVLLIGKSGSVKVKTVTPIKSPYPYF